MASSVAVPSPVDEKDVIINRLTEENLQLKSDVDLLKERVKSINNYLQAAQEGKNFLFIYQIILSKKVEAV